MTQQDKLNELLNLLGEVDERTFWKWVSTWYDADMVLDIVANWEEGARSANELQEEIDSIKQMT